MILLLTSSFSQTFTKEYTYNASETDSKVSARKSAMLQIQMLVIEEYGVDIQSSFHTKTISSKDKYSKENTKLLETFSHAVTKTKILKESWDGDKFYLKVTIEVDKNKFITAPAKDKKTKEQKCNNTKEKAIKILYDLSSKDKIDKAVEYFITYKFDTCHKWHYDVLNSFSKNNINPLKYRNFLLKTLENIDKPSMDYRSKQIILYLLKNMTKEEFNIVFISLQKSNRIRVDDIIRILASKHNQIDTYTFDTILDESKNNTIGRPVPLVQDIIVSTVLKSLLSSNIQLFYKYYPLYQSTISNDEKLNYYRKIKRDFFRKPNKNGFNFIVQYFINSKNNNRISNQLYSFIQDTQRQIDDYKKENLKEYLQLFIKSTTNIINQTFPLVQNNTQLVARKLLVLKYDIDIEFTPKAKVIGKKLITQKDKNKVFVYAKYLSMMKQNAKPAIPFIVNYFKLKKPMFSTQGTTTTALLLKALENTKTTNKKAILYIVKYLNSGNIYFYKESIDALNAIGSSSFSILNKKFYKQSRQLDSYKKDKIRKDIILIMSNFTNISNEVISFLKTIKTNNPELLDTIDETIDEFSL